MRLPQRITPISLRFPSIVFCLTLAAAVIACTPASAQLVSSAVGLRFGTVTVGQAETQLFLVSNIGPNSATISAINVPNSQFAVSGVKFPIAVGAGQSIPVSLVFTPQGDGWTGGRLTISSNAPNPNLPIQIGGTGVSSAALTCSPASLSFGQVAVGSTATQVVTLTNKRSWRETLAGLQTWGSGFSVSGPSTPMNLGAGQSIQITVTYSPQAAGLVGGSVFVNGPAVNLPISGTGISAGQLSVAPSSLSFGNTQVGSTATQTNTVTATGGNVTINSVGSSNSQFAINGASFPMMINAGQSATFSVTFTPTQAGAASGALTYSSNASDSRVGEPLSGTGTAAVYSVSLSWTGSTSEVAGYNVYRGTAPGSYSKINSAVDPNTVFTDNAAAGGNTYYYAATSVSTTGQESGYSSPVQVAIP